MKAYTPADVDRTLKAIRREKARRSLAEFVRQGWDILEPGTPLIWNWHLDAMALHLEAVARGEIRKLLINVPPGCMKSLMVSVFWPAWMWVDRPEWRCLSSSYAMDLAERDSVRCRDLLTSEWFQTTFEPDWTFKTDQNVKRQFENTRRGFRFSLSVGGRATGFRGDCIIVDDPLNAKEQHSEVARNECLFWWDKVMWSRLNDQRTGTRVIIMQRLHEEDLAGHVLRQGGWELLCLPSEFEPDRLDGDRDCIPRRTAIGWEDPRRDAGELLFPELFTAEVLADAKRSLGSADFAGQHQQRPSPADGAIFKREWFSSRYRRLPPMAEVWSCWDTAMKAGEKNDESACTVIGRGVDGYLYVLRVTHGRWETPDLARFLIAQAKWLRDLYGEAYRGDYVEDKSSGTTLMQYVRRTDPDLALIGIQVDGDKEARAHGITPVCEARQVLLPDPEIFPDTRSWVSELLSQLIAFPNGRLDDVLDTFVYALKRHVGTLGSKKSRKGKGGGWV